MLSLGLFTGAGAIMLPTLTAASLAVWRGDWRRAWRVVLAVVAAPAASPVTASGELRARHAVAAIVDVAGNDVGFATFVEDATGRVHVNVKVASRFRRERCRHSTGMGARSTA